MGVPLDHWRSEATRPWIVFCIASVLLVWSNYFGFAFLFLLLADLLVFHRDLARKNVRSLWMVIAFVAAGFLPLLPLPCTTCCVFVAPVRPEWNWKNELPWLVIPASQSSGQLPSRRGTSPEHADLSLCPRAVCGGLVQPGAALAGLRSSLHGPALHLREY